MSEAAGVSAALQLAQAIEADLAEYTTPATPGKHGGPDEYDSISPEHPLLVAFDARVSDPDLRTSSRSRFVSGHYADAVEGGVKALNECIRARTGRLEDGDGLMTVVFSPSKPILRLNRLKSKADESAQRGHMLLCQGVVAAWRNPRAHNHVEDEPEKALMMLETINELILVSKAAIRTRKRR